jgi:hypothetical protein
MTFTFPAIALPIAMLLSAIFIAMWLASKQSKIIDAIAFLVAIFCVVWLLFAVHVL